jgi:glycosyltransferase involved in cell wall biosynthesis
MIERKGVDLLLTAFCRMVEAGQRLTLTLVGREAELPQMLKGLPAEVRERISYAGFQAPEALPRFFAEADVFVLPSRYDGWGVVVNQALGAGLPVVCSDAVGAAEDLVIPGENGYVFPSGDAAALQAALEAVTGEAGRIASFSARSLELSARLGPEYGARQLQRILAEVVERWQQGRR